MESHVKFIDDQQIPFQLLADEGNKVRSWSCKTSLTTHNAIHCRTNFSHDTGEKIISLCLTAGLHAIISMT